MAFLKTCKICESADWEELYRGAVRVGKFGNNSSVKHCVWKCKKCKAGFFDRPEVDYESLEYRDLVDGDSSVSNYYSLHDKEQSEKIQVLGTEKLRNKVIADVGCGAGSFLDMVKGITSETIAVEPARYFHEEIKRKGHKVYSYTHQALTDWKGQVDIVVSFAVLEHLKNPLQFLKEAKSLIKQNGYLLLSTPNYEDWLIEFLKEVYAPFFYRYVHTWYFNGESLQFLAKEAGFENCKLEYRQRFDISNALLWTRDHKPTGLGATEFLGSLNGAYKQHVEKSGVSDFIFAKLH